MPRLEQLAWGEQVRRLAHARILLDPRVREIQGDTKRAVADADSREGRVAAIRAGQDRLGAHVGLGPRPE